MVEMEYLNIEELIDVVEKEFGDCDTIYARELEKAIGANGVFRLLQAGALETCGWVAGRQMVALVR